MLLGGKGGCQQCTCVPCDECTRTCQNPYTGTEFKPVYTRFFEGVEDGNPSDGYLSASGDSDTSDPYNGMDGSGPWFQQITGGFTLDSTQTRFPCRVTVSLWRNQYGVGVQSIPPPSTALTFQGVFVTVSSGAVVVGDRFIVPADGEVQIETVSIPLVTGNGDQSENIPRFYEGSISVAPLCESASFSIRARIEWNTQRRQHVLYGLVRECYEEGTPCYTYCNGNPAPEDIYLTITNFPSGNPDSPFFVNGTYVLERIPTFCDGWIANWPDDCTGFSSGSEKRIVISKSRINGITMSHHTPINGGACVNLYMMSTTTVPVICGTGVIGTGSGEFYYEGVYGGTFSWEISA
jgi:hypothetical protein